MRLAAFAVLEEISYTRKDGQYLRWDYRSKRNLSGKQFDKGTIRTFETAITTKLAEMVEDNIPGGGINPSGAALNTFPGLYNAGGTLYFAANDGTNNGLEL